MTTLYLLTNIPLDPEYKYTLDFNDATAQQNYFLSKKLTEYDITADYSYLRADKPITIEATRESLNAVNYLMYKNADKWYFCFITSKDYINENVTRLNIQTDVLQTFAFDYSLSESFVEREHKDRYSVAGSTLTPIYSIESENLEAGQYYLRTARTAIPDAVPSVLSDLYNMTTFKLFWATIVAKSPIGKQAYTLAGGLISGTQPDTVQATDVKGMPTNVYTYVMPVAIFMGDWLNKPIMTCISASGQENYIPFITETQFLGLTKDPLVISISLSRYAPFTYNCTKEIITIDGLQYPRYEFYPVAAPEGSSMNDIKLTTYNNDSGTYSGAMFFIAYPQGRSVVLTVPRSITINKSLLSISNLKNIAYEPKLKTNPYFFYRFELGGKSVNLNNEELGTGNISFKYLASYSIKDSAAFIPLNYAGQSENYDTALTIDSTQNEIPLRTDAWLTYLSAHKSSLVSGYITGAATTAASVAMTSMSGGLALPIAGVSALNFSAGIANDLAAQHDLKTAPNEVRQTALDVVFDYAEKDLFVTMNTYEIKDVFKNKIFNYFYHYGYKVNTFETPNLKSRYYFNYIKTVGANISTNIDAADAEKITNIYNNGLTLWHYRDAATFKGVNNYDYENVETNILEV